MNNISSSRPTPCLPVILLSSLVMIISRGSSIALAPPSGDLSRLANFDSENSDDNRQELSAEVSAHITYEAAYE
ncbi:hypothetical protein WG66_003463 [Moniliophthora roreri]|nr:hypothetical protein WG66_003463 [Moniliophthora roreri]